MKQRPLKVSATILLTVVLLGLLATTAYAANHNEGFEAKSYYIGTGPRDGIFSLTYLGRGCPAADDDDDYRFGINVNYSSNYNDWKFYSSNSKYQRVPTGRVFNGYYLDTTGPYVCIGVKEFLPFRWTIAGVEQNVYVWRK